MSKSSQGEIYRMLRVQHYKNELEKDILVHRFDIILERKHKQIVYNKLKQEN
jgi:hypothetical protein